MITINAISKITIQKSSTNLEERENSNIVFNIKKSYDKILIENIGTTEVHGNTRPMLEIIWFLISKI